MAGRRLKIATEAISDPYGGLWTHTRSVQRFSRHRIMEYPSRPVRFFLNRNRDLRGWHRRRLKRSGIRGFDIVHSRSEPWFIEACASSRSPRCRWVQSFHAMFYEEDYADGLQFWQAEQNRAVLEVGAGADARISVARWWHDHLLERFSIDTAVIVNGVDVEECGGARAEDFTGKFGLEDFYLFVGSFREVKNPTLFLELASRMPDRRFVMIGDGLNAGKLREKYGVEAPGNVALLGRLPRKDTLDAMAACSAYVMTSKHEGLPNTLLEAMAIARPVVVPAHTGCLELVPGGEYGFLYDLSSLEELVGQAERAIGAEEVGRKARERVARHFNWKDSVKKLDDLYSSLA